jgi:hypothetical protein
LNTCSSSSSSGGGSGSNYGYYDQKILDDNNNYGSDPIQVLEQKSNELLLRKSKSEFTKELEEINSLLETIDPAPSALFKKIDQKAQDLSTYFLVAYSDTKDIGRALQVYKIVKSLIRYIVLMDRYYEVGDLKYKRAAQKLLQNAKKGSSGHMRYTVSFAMARCWPFWDFEKLMTKRIVKEKSFTLKEIRYHNKFKSSDAPGIYGSVLDSELFHYTDNVGLLLHYNQAIQDAIDDFMDLEEDLAEKLPNIFIMATINEIPLEQILLRADKIREIVTFQTQAYTTILNLVKEYAECAYGIEVPKEYEFLKILTSIYLNQFTRLVAVVIEEEQLEQKITEVPKLIEGGGEEDNEVRAIPVSIEEAAANVKLHNNNASLPAIYCSK